MQPIHRHKPAGCEKIKKDLWNHKSSSALLFKIFYRETSKFCFNPESYFKTPSGEIYGFGTVYKFCSALGPNRIRLESTGKKYVAAESIGHRSDFLRMDEYGFYLVKGIV